MPLVAVPIATASRPATAQPAPRALRDAVQQFEAIFVDLMLRAARAATATLSTDSPFASFEGDLHREMFDAEIARSVAGHGGVGLAPVMLAQLSPHAAATESASDARDPTTVMPARQTSIRSVHVARAGATGQPAARAAIDAGDPDRAASPSPSPQRVEATRADAEVSFDSPTRFVATVLPIIERAVAGTPFAPLGILAQAALETGWGRHVIGLGEASSHNLFGIKAGRGGSVANAAAGEGAGNESGAWRGEAISTDTLEVRDGVLRRERAAFRAYGSFDDSVRDLVALLTTSPRYAAVADDGGTAHGYAQAIDAAGYATDPDYRTKLERVLRHPAIRAVAADHEAERSRGATR